MKKIVFLLLCFCMGVVVINARFSHTTMNVAATNMQQMPVVGYDSNQTFTVNGVSFTMIGVEGGTFKMGASAEQEDANSDEEPIHEVTLSNFLIGETEVTQALWVAVMESNPSWFKGETLPVENVSWDECQAFVAKLNAATNKQFRLPTEAEWEYAARGGKLSKGFLYSGSNNVADVAWYEENSKEATHPVKSKMANELGLYDMSGNVWEWCQDWYDYYDEEAQTNPVGPEEGDERVCRGGCWSVASSRCRSARRYDVAPDGRGYHIGLRLALSE